MSDEEGQGNRVKTEDCEEEEIPKRRNVVLLLLVICLQIAGACFLCNHVHAGGDAIFTFTLANTPYEFNGFRYIASWRDLYTSIWVTLKDGIKDEYRLQDYDNKFNVVTAKTMKPIIEKMTDINDEMFIDKHNLQLYFLKNDNFEQLQAKFDEYTKKVYK